MRYIYIERQRERGWQWLGKLKGGVGSGVPTQVVPMGVAFVVKKQIVLKGRASQDLM